jgi:toxin ParE1/3/4
MAHSVVFTPEARDQLQELYRYIEKEASPSIAQRFTGNIIDHCAKLREFPERGVRRDDIRPGLRITNYKGRVAIAFAIGEQDVSIIGVFYGGRDYGSLLQSELDE